MNDVNQWVLDFLGGLAMGLGLFILLFGLTNCQQAKAGDYTSYQVEPAEHTAILYGWSKHAPSGVEYNEEHDTLGYENRWRSGPLVYGVGAATYVNSYGDQSFALRGTVGDCIGGYALEWCYGGTAGVALGYEDNFWTPKPAAGLLTSLTYEGVGAEIFWVPTKVIAIQGRVSFDLEGLSFE